MLLIFVCFLFTFSSTLPLTLTPSKWILTSFDPQLTLHCSLTPLSLSFKLSSPRTPLIFTANRRVIFNSSSPGSSLAGVTYFNITTVSIRNVTSGIINATCSFADERSPEITVPFIENVIYAASKIANRQQCNVIKCIAKIVPLMPKFSVNFELDDECIGQWKIEAPKPPTWLSRDRHFDLSVQKGNTSAPVFTAVLCQKGSHKTNVYRKGCSVTVPLPHSSLTIKNSTEKEVNRTLANNNSTVAEQLKIIFKNFNMATILLSVFIYVIILQMFFLLFSNCKILDFDTN